YSRLFVLDVPNALGPSVLISADPAGSGPSRTPVPNCPAQQLANFSSSFGRIGFSPPPRTSGLIVPNA
ncbi:hypothetical protein KI387_008064, partial [Taxus chinensis]